MLPFFQTFAASGFPIDRYFISVVLAKRLPCLWRPKLWEWEFRKPAILSCEIWELKKLGPGKFRSEKFGSDCVSLKKIWKFALPIRTLTLRKFTSQTWHSEVSKSWNSVRRKFTSQRLILRKVRSRFVNNVVWELLKWSYRSRSFEWNDLILSWSQMGSPIVAYPKWQVPLKRHTPESYAADYLTSKCHNSENNWLPAHTTPKCRAAEKCHSQRSGTDLHVLARMKHNNKTLTAYEIRFRESEGWLLKISMIDHNHRIVK